MTTDIIAIPLHVSVDNSFRSFTISCDIIWCKDDILTSLSQINRHKPKLYYTDLKQHKSTRINYRFDAPCYVLNRFNSIYGYSDQIK